MDAPETRTHFRIGEGGFEAIGKHLAEEYPDANKGCGISIFPLRQDMLEEIRLFLLVLLGAVGFVLLIAWRQQWRIYWRSNPIRELSVRIALGASRSRMLRQLLTESGTCGSESALTTL